MRCLVTGASGHIGSHLTRLLAERGHDVTAMVRPSSDLWRLDNVLNRIQLLRADLDDLDSAADAVSIAMPETVFHLAWAGITTGTRNLSANLETNVSGSLRLFRLAQGAGCRCWVGLGSQAEYGQTTEVLRDDLSPSPNTLYGVAKLSLSNLTEALCRETRVRYVWLRLAAAYGPMDDPHHLIPTLIAKLLAGERPLLTNGIQEWDYLYINDVVEAIYGAGMPLGVEGESLHGKFVLAYGKSYPVRFIAERIRDMIDPSLPLGFGELPVSSPPPHSLRADISGLRGASGWAPQTDLETGLRRTLDWLRSEGSRKTGT